MKNPTQGRDPHRDNPTEIAEDKKASRGLLALGHAFFNKHNADTAEENEQKRIERQWIKCGVRAAILYTAVTTVVMVCAITQVWVSRTTEKRQLRAYISVAPDPKQGSSVIIDKDKRSVQAIVALVNHGITPGKHIQLWGAAKALERPITDAKLNDSETSLFRQQFSSFPGDELTNAGIGTQLTPTEWDNVTVNSPKEVLYVFGFITYEDIFGDSHRTDFCFFADHAATGQRWEACDRHTDFD